MAEASDRSRWPDPYHGPGIPRSERRCERRGQAGPGSLRLVDHRPRTEPEQLTTTPSKGSGQGRDVEYRPCNRTDTDRVAVPPVPLPGVGGMASLEAERRRRRPVEGTETVPDPGKSRAMRLFPTVVWRAEVRPGAHAAASTRRSLPSSPRCDAERPTPAAGRGWQSGHNLHELEDFHELIESIGVTVKDIRSTICVSPRWRFEITGCWANVNAPGAAHRLHSHPNNFLSGVYYVCVPRGGDTINFHDPRSQAGNPAAAGRRAHRRQYRPGGRAG